ncbi:hypothetical protein E8E12_000463 [Didymella heteroderae]|uniref:DUF7924 domain-containing protein n=1 Tax=Didymella heteroderae TaxID=1769908 RepID=A0A9P4WH28_9PLEO|nr:hypothetical protein E8E12_000463 [Didymella heteroderae]
MRNHNYSTPRLPLTEENLRALAPITSVTEKASPMSTPRNPSPTRKESVRTHLKRLAGYNITFDHGTPFPNALAQFVKTLEIPREETPSPHAQAVVDTRRAAAMENESTGRRMMEGHLLFYGETHADGMPGLTLKDQVNLVRDYLPPPPRPTVPELWGTLPRPQPDSCIGYITATEAKTHNPPLIMPFSREEDDIAEWYNVVHHSDMHFPFLTAQWKAAMSGDNQIDARLQAARDGALIVNYMHHFYSHAYPDRDPSQLETCHVSLTTEMITSYLWLHWREVDPTIQEETVAKLDDYVKLKPAVRHADNAFEL